MLRELPRWLLHRAKRPYSAHTGHPCDPTDPAACAPLSAALGAQGAFDGIGFALFAGDELVGVDLDKCRDSETGAIEPWAREIVAALDSYTEVSPSGTGLHIFARGTLPEGGRRRGRVEMYDSARYLTVTGRHVEGTPATVEDRRSTLAELHTQLFPPEPKRPTPIRPGVGDVSADDAEIVAWIEAHPKYGPLWRGDTSAYGDDESRAELGLCSGLAYRCGPDSARVDRLFRASGLFALDGRADKWDARHFADGTTYGERTVTRATNKTAFWTAPTAGEVVRLPIPAPAEGDGDEELPPAARAQLVEALAEVERLRVELADSEAKRAQMAANYKATYQRERELVRTIVWARRVLKNPTLSPSLKVTWLVARADGETADPKRRRPDGLVDIRLQTMRGKSGIGEKTLSKNLHTLRDLGALACKVERDEERERETGQRAQRMAIAVNPIEHPERLEGPERGHGGKRTKRACPHCKTVGAGVACRECGGTFTLDEAIMVEVANEESTDGQDDGRSQDAPEPPPDGQDDAPPSVAVSHILGNSFPQSLDAAADGQDDARRAELRADVLAAVAAIGWRAVALSSRQTEGGSERLWRMFADEAPPEMLRLALACVRLEKGGAA